MGHAAGVGVLLVGRGNTPSAEVELGKEPLVLKPFVNLIERSKLPQDTT